MKLDIYVIEPNADRARAVTHRIRFSRLPCACRTAWKPSKICAGNR